METNAASIAPHADAEDRPSTPRRLQYRAIIFGAISVIFVVAMFCMPRRLTPQEARIAKLWVMPMPPNSPANAVQQSWNFERSGRCSLGHRGTVGSWHLRGDVLEYSASEPGVQGIGKALLYTFGCGPRPRHIKQTWLIREVTETSLTVENYFTDGPPMKLITLTER